MTLERGNQPTGRLCAETGTPFASVPSTADLVDQTTNGETAMTTTFARFLNDESGATAIEYGLIAALIAVGIILAATTVGSNISNTFNNVSKKL